MFFCEEKDGPLNLHSASTMDIDKNVRECAGLLNDRKVIAKLSAGNMIATEAKYHTKCLVTFYNRARPLKQKATKSVSDEDSTTDLEKLAFAELLAYIEEHLEFEKPAIITLSDLVAFYTCKPKELGACSGEIYVHD